MRVLLDNQFVRVEELEAQRVVIVRRKPTTVPIADVPAIYASAFALARPEHREWGVVVDVRAVPGRNDPDFERAMRPVRLAAAAAFGRVVVLVRSMVGRMQIERTRREDRMAVHVTDDEVEAIALAERALEDASYS